MSDFKTVTLTQQALDPSKRVNYTMGLVLGEDEFDQEQFYLMERDRLHNRSLHGYGTVHGLRVAIRNSTGGPEVVVSPGLAVNPQGQTIQVPLAQCARLNAWLERYRATVAERHFSPPGRLALYVVLCYRECETDMVPIPGGPCRSQEDSMAASRIADDFELSLRLDPPPQIEEAVIQRFGELLGRVEISDAPGTFVTQQEMEDLVRDLGQELSSPPLDSPPAAGSPPAMETRLRLHPDEACDILRAAFRVWVTDVRPALLGASATSTGALADSACVSLARLDFPVDASWQVAGPVTIHDDDRPILLHTRLLQEWLVCGRLGRAADTGIARTFATLYALDATTIRAWLHHPELLTLPLEAITVEIQDMPSGPPPQVLTVTQPGAGLNIFDLQLDAPLAHRSRVTVRFDASRMTLVIDPTSTLLATLDQLDYVYLDQDGSTLLAYLAVNRPTHAQLDGLGGDDHPQYLTVPRANARYAPLAHTHTLNDLEDVDAPAPADGEILVRQGGQWVASGNVVQAPAGSYAIVAAGFINANGTPRDPVYNDLDIDPAVSNPAQGEYVLTFTGYNNPNDSPGKFMYIVKGTVEDDNEPQRPRATLQFVGFQRTGIHVRVLDIQNQPKQELGFMVEISQFPFP